MPTLLLAPVDQLDITKRALALVEKDGASLETAVFKASFDHECAMEPENFRYDWNEEYHKSKAHMRRIKALFDLMWAEIEEFHDELPYEWLPKRFTMHDVDGDYVIRGDIAGSVCDSVAVAHQNLARLFAVIDKHAKRHMQQQHAEDGRLD